MPLDSASTTSLSLPPAAAATAFDRDIDTETAAKLRSDEIDLLRMVEGAIASLRPAIAPGSLNFDTTPDSAFAMSGRPLMKSIGCCNCRLKLSMRTAPRSWRLPERMSGSLPCAVRPSGSAHRLAYPAKSSPSPSDFFASSFFGSVCATLPSP